jgi:hypothetical protein
MNKPEWKDAPDWARYLARDEDNSWRWFARKPKLLGCEFWESTGRVAAAYGPAFTYWHESLEKRPKRDSTTQAKKRNNNA